MWLLLAIAFGLLDPYFEQTRNANERPRVMQAMALVDAGEWAIDGVAVRGLEAGPDTARSKQDGRLYPNKPPGTTLVAAIGYRGAVALAGPEGPNLREVTGWGRWLAGAIPTLVLAIVLWRRHADAFGPGATMAAVLTWALATPAVVYAHLLYGHALAAMLLHAGITAVAMGIERDAARDRWTWCVIGGALAGSAVAVEYIAAFAAIPIGAVLLSRWRAHAGMPSATVAALVGALIPIVLLAAYHDAVFGSAFSTGYQHATVADFASKHGQGLLGLGWPTWHGISVHLFSVDGGLLWWAPLVVPGLYGLVLVARDDTRRFEGRVHLGLVLLFLWINVSLSFEGGWRVGPRYFVLALPSFVLGWAELYAQTRTRATWTALLFGLGVYGVVVNALAANLWPHFDLAGVDAPVAEVLLPLWRGDLRPYVGWGVVSGVPTDLVTVVVVTSVIGFALVWARAVELTLRTSMALLAGLALGVSLVFMHGALPRNPKGERNLAYIEKVWEPHAKPGRSVVLPPLGRGDAEPVQRVVPSRSTPQ